VSAVEFDLLGELPQGTTVLEASAGTGKTFTIAGLVARYVAEGAARIDELLVVTFGRSATQELRDRVRERLVSARDGLADPAAARESGDALLAHLASADVEARRARLVEALATFDAATVATTHQFCQQVLIGLGTAGDVDAAAVLVENLDDLTVEVVADLYVRMWGRDNAELPPLSYADAVQLAHVVVHDGQAELVPDGTPADAVPDLRRRFALAVRAEVDRRKRDRYLLSFDDLLTRLQHTLAADASGAAAQRLRRRYRVVLVDEFQDTDPVQWDILRLAFHGHATLVLIGDPKQAIYAFRGADVHAYLGAAAIADRQATLAQNWRSDPELLHGLDRLFRGAALGDPRIVVAPVSAAHSGRSLDDGAAPVQLRVIGGRKTAVGTARARVVADLVRYVTDTLDSEVRLSPRDGGPARPVRPGDLAVVVDTNVQLDLVHTALLAAGVPSVQRTTSSVFRTAAGTEWVILLEALEQPHRIGRVRRLAISSFVGWGAAELDTGDLDRLSLRLRHWLAVFEERGVAALLAAISRDERLASRLLGQLDGERRLTDLRHVGEALHAAAAAGRLGLTASLEWLRRRVQESDRDGTVERSRRLDSDAAAVQVVTVWASKGLEFPIVLVPFEWDRFVRDEMVPLFHDTDGRRVRDVGGPDGTAFAAHRARDRDEQLGEDLRLLYVGLTRAQARVIAWWAPSAKNTECAPLHRLLFATDPATEVPARAPVPEPAGALARLAAYASDDCLSVTEVFPQEAVRWSGAATPDTALSIARLGRAVDAAWRRTSYSALTHAAHEASVSSEPEVGEKDDEPVTAEPAIATGDDPLRGVPSPMSALPGGTSFGTLVHAVLERVDPSTADLAAELHSQAALQLARFGSDGLTADDLVAGLLPAYATPLGALADGRPLAGIASADRLTELDFELPLRGGDQPNGVGYLRELADVLRSHLPGDDPLAGYADLLADPLVGDAVLRGYLGGSIDAVLRVDGRYLVVDYKTNRLATPDEPLTAWHYRAEAMAVAMLQAHYPLQALLYDVALHRFLRWRLPGYRPDEHLGGVLYLFLRGMCGPSVAASRATVPGVFAWRPPAALVVAASDVLDRGSAT
jgi:exodeoxyribonuclease V beta subunit